MIDSHTQIKIPFHDVDMMQVAWHGYYLKYFEIARADLLDKIGYNYRQMKESGYLWPVIDMRIKFIQPIRFEMLIDIKVTLVEYENRLKMEYLITNAKTKQRLTKGYTTQVAVDATTGEMCMISPNVLIEKIIKP